VLADKLINTTMFSASEIVTVEALPNFGFLAIPVVYPHFWPESG
jgi:hypothetical protein